MPARPAPNPANAPADVAVVLVHGYLCVSPALYWSGLLPLRRALAARGVAVLASRQPRTASVELRARRLALALARLPQRRLVLVGHSMGGLDARLVASRLDPSRRVSHVLTVGTPHRGSPLAERALRSPRWRGRLLRLLDRGALLDLTAEGAERLNAAAPDREDVRYLSLAGALPPEVLPSLLRPLAERLAADGAANDGMVTVASAAWGVHAPVVPADHLSLIGTPTGRGSWAAPGGGPGVAALGWALGEALGAAG
jgi:triacylglycerol lipase